MTPSADACFYSETLVLIRLDAPSYEAMRGYLAAGSTPETFIGVPLKSEIQCLKPGVEVLSRCEASGEIAYRKIAKVFEHDPQKVFDVGYDSEGERDYGFITVTGNSPIWVVGRGWVPACELKPKDELLSFDGLRAEVSSVDPGKYEVLYSLEVEEFHTYFVDWAGIWVRDKNQTAGG